MLRPLFGGFENTGVGLFFFLATRGLAEAGLRGTNGGRPGGREGPLPARGGGGALMMGSESMGCTL